MCPVGDVYYRFGFCGQWMATAAIEMTAEYRRLTISGTGGQDGTFNISPAPSFIQSIVFIFHVDIIAIANSSFNQDADIWEAVYGTGPTDGAMNVR